MRINSLVALAVISIAPLAAQLARAQRARATPLDTFTST